MATKTLSSDVHALVSLLILGEWNVEVGREVVGALARMGNRAVPVLADVLEPPRHTGDRTYGRVTRMAAAWLLARTGSRRAFDALCSAQEDADPEVAAVARRALAALDPSHCRGAA